MGLFFYYCLFLTWSFAYAGVPNYLSDLSIPGYQKLWKPAGKKGPTGIEYGDISRGTLLKLMAEFAQHTEARLRPRRLRAQLTAHFANNKYTKPFIYPQFYRNN